MLRDLKGPDVFIDAFAKTERRVGRPLSALMIGDGPDEEKYERTMLRLGLGRRIAMMPAMKAREAFAMARAVVVPSRAESMPYIVLEALAPANVPVIASRVGGIPEALGRSNTALAEPADADALADTMARSVTDPEMAVPGDAGPQTFKDAFSASVMAASMMKLYRELVPGAGINGRLYRVSPSRVIVS